MNLELLEYPQIFERFEHRPLERGLEIVRSVVVERWRRVARPQLGTGLLLEHPQPARMIEVWLRVQKHFDVLDAEAELRNARHDPPRPAGARQAVITIASVAMLPIASSVFMGGLSRPVGPTIANEPRGASLSPRGARGRSDARAGSELLRRHSQIRRACPYPMPELPGLFLERSREEGLRFRAIVVQIGERAVFDHPRIVIPVDGQRAVERGLRLVPLPGLGIDAADAEARTELFVCLRRVTSARRAGGCRPRRHGSTYSGDWWLLTIFHPSDPFAQT